MQPRALASVSRRVIAICECALCAVRACVFFCAVRQKSQETGTALDSHFGTSGALRSNRRLWAEGRQSAGATGTFRYDMIVSLVTTVPPQSSQVVTTAAIPLAVLLLLLLLLLLKTARLRALCRQGSRASVRRTLAAVALPLRPAHSVPAAPLGEGEVAVEQRLLRRRERRHAVASDGAQDCGAHVRHLQAQAAA